MNNLDIDLQEEIIEALNFTINSGYFSVSEIQELATEYLSEIFEDYELPKPSGETIQEITQAVQQAHSADKQMNYLRLRKIFDQLNQQGIIAIDFAGFDISEGLEDVGEVVRFMQEQQIPRQGYCFCHQQDIERALDSESRILYLAFHSTNGDEEQALRVAEKIVELFTEAGLQPRWDGSLDERICLLNFEWDKVFDAETDYGVERAIRIMKAAF
ncbi:DUF6891 domain-containing protein [Enterococcus sp. LJL90]